MKQLLSILLAFTLAVAGYAADAANDVVLSQRKADNSGFIQRNLAPVASGFFGFDSSKVPAAPTFLTFDATSLKLSSAATSGLQLYNTVDQVTNYERLEALWSSNVATVRAISAGSGTAREIRLQAGSAFIGVSPSNATTGHVRFSLTGSGATTAGAVGVDLGTFLNNATSGTNVAVRITPTYNQASGTAANTDLLINRTQAAVGSGAQLLADFQVGGATRFNVTNGGDVTAIGNITGVTGFFTTVSAPTLGAGGGVATVIRSNATTAITISTTQQATFVGSIITTPQLLSGAGAVNVTTGSTHFTSTGVAQALTLANATAGQRKTVIHSVDGGSGVLTPASAIGFTTITFTNVGDAVDLEYTAAGWAIVGIRGAVAA